MFLGFFEMETGHVAQAGLQLCKLGGGKDIHCYYRSLSLEGPRVNEDTSDLKAERPLFGKKTGTGGDRGQGEEH